MPDQPSIIGNNGLTGKAPTKDIMKFVLDGFPQEKKSSKSGKKGRRRPEAAETSPHLPKAERRVLNFGGGAPV